MKTYNSIIHTIYRGKRQAFKMTYQRPGYLSLSVHLGHQLFLRYVQNKRYWRFENIDVLSLKENAYDKKRLDSCRVIDIVEIEEPKKELFKQFDSYL